MLKKACCIVFTLLLPVCFFISVWQSNRFFMIQRDISQLYEEQEQIVKLNTRIISEITILSTPEVIEKKAVEKLAMRKASSDEIIRIELKRGDLGG